MFIGNYWLAAALFFVFMEDVRGRRFIFRGLRIKRGFWWWFATSEVFYGLVGLNLFLYSCAPGVKSDSCMSVWWFYVLVASVSAGWFSFFSNKIVVEASSS